MHSAVFDTGATSNCGRIQDDFIPTTTKSNKIFHMPTGHTTTASYQAKLHHIVREPARTVDLVPELQNNSLISGPKFADANYITILTPDEVLIYDGTDLQLSVNHKAILRGWRDQASGLWWVPLNPKVKGNPNKSEYCLLSKASEEAIANVYDLPSSQQIVRYLHGCAGFPTKATWLAAIQKGSFAFS